MLICDVNVYDADNGIFMYWYDIIKAYPQFNIICSGFGVLRF